MYQLHKSIYQILRYKPGATHPTGSGLSALHPFFSAKIWHIHPHEYKYIATKFWHWEYIPTNLSHQYSTRFILATICLTFGWILLATLNVAGPAKTGHVGTQVYNFFKLPFFCHSHEIFWYLIDNILWYYQVYRIQKYSVPLGRNDLLCNFAGLIPNCLDR